MSLIQSDLLEDLGLIVFQCFPEKNEIVFETCPSSFFPVTKKTIFSVNDILQYFPEKEKGKLNDFFDFCTWGNKSLISTMKEKSDNPKTAKACSVKIYQMNKGSDTNLTGAFHNISPLMPSSFLHEEVEFIINGLPEIRKVTHDLNNKFQIITGFGSVIEDEATDPEIKECIENVMTALYGAIDLTKRFRSLLPSKKRNEIYPGTNSNENIIVDQPDNKAKILVIDDEPMVQRFLCEMIKRLKYEAIGANDGNSSIEKVQSTTFALAILDMNLPDINSEELFCKLQESQPQMKIILISGDELNDDSQSLLDKGANAFIQKPTSVKKLSEIINRLLDK